MRRGRPARFLATVLFTDIADSTRLAVERGDRDWRELLERHHAIVREQLRLFDGREIDTAGDGFFVTFEAPAQAVACALSVSELVARLGIHIRAGVHMGEVEQIGPKVGGVAVHIGARIMASAPPGEVLVSSTVRDLVTGSGIGFEDRGDHELKGVPGTWRLFVATGGDQLRAAAARRGGEKTRALRVRRRSRRGTRTLVVGATAVILLAGGLLAAVVLDRSPPSIAAIDENSAGIIDLASGRLVAAVPVGARPVGVTLGGGAVWVANSTTGTVSRIDAATRAVVDRIEVGADPAGLAAGFDSIWVANSGDGTVSRINTTTNAVVQTVGVGNGPVAVAVGPDAVWVANRIDATVSRIDPADGTVTTTINLASAPSAIVADERAVWVAAPDTGVVIRIHPSTAEVVASVRVGTSPEAVALAPDGLWVGNSRDATVSRINVGSNTVEATIAVGAGPVGIVATADAIWVACSLDGAVYRVERGAATGTRVEVGSAPTAIAASEDALWITTHASAASHRGGILQVVSEHAPDSLDPAIGFSPESWGVLALTNDGLVGLARSPGIAGTSLVPNLATSIPQPADGGRSYTFQLRQGLAYSTGEPVKASDLRHALQRVFDVPASADESVGPTFYAAIVGADRCFEAFDDPCDLSQGIVTDDAAGIVTFRLQAPDPEFLFKLVLPFASAVPATIPGDAASAEPVPATGPYMVSETSPTSIRLVRNPRFVPRPAPIRPDGFVDEIVLTSGLGPDEQVERVLRGEADWMVDRIPPERIEELRTGRPGQLYPYVQGTVFAWMNTSRPPFDDVRVRQAVNFAIDRDRAVQAFGGPFRGQVTCQALPPNFYGYVPYCPYTLTPNDGGTWTAPDMAAAMELVRASGSAGAATPIDVAAFGPFVGPAEHLVSVLDELGYDATLLAFDTAPEWQEHVFDPVTGAEVEAGVIAWFVDYPAASSVFVPNFTCDELGNLSRFCDPDVDRLMDEALALQPTDSSAANRLWADVDRAVVDGAAWAPLLNIRELGFVSERVGNYHLHPQWLLLLDQVWVQ